MPADRPLDLTVFGATGFVGKLLAAYLAEHAPDEVRIGLAGRSEEKLAKARDDLPERAHDWPLITADSGDADSLRKLAEGTRVVATTVGPYRKSGLPLVEACAAAGTHYADLTGEVLFVHECIERAHDKARESGAKIVNSTGFDSIPSDMSVYALHERVRADDEGELEQTTLVVTALKGGASGGTVASMKGQVDEVKTDKEARKLAADPYALDPSGGPNGSPGDERDSYGVSRDEDLGQWIGPFVMASFNTRIVRRSNAVQDYAYGRGFRYREVTGLGSGPLAPVKGAGLAGGLGALAGGLAFPPTRKLLDHLLPDPGEGPDEEARRNGFFRMELHARTSSGAKYVVRVAMQGDPGYAATAVMMGEAALCLALDGEKLPDRAGVLTPASAMDGALIERLRAAGMKLEVERAF
ncbi:MAG: hypothetical protein QOG63_2413 [Thermoleophilaceae bacterium]|nr:hypothetical protein [Thermoleophilaceae bacterium]